MIKTFTDERCRVCGVYYQPCDTTPRKAGCCDSECLEAYTAELSLHLEDSGAKPLRAAPSYRWSTIEQNTALPIDMTVPEAG